MKLPKEIQDNLITYLEAARLALADADIFDHVVEQLDIADEEMTRLTESLQTFLDQD